jgi:hypothetical protein
MKKTVSILGLLAVLTACAPASTTGGGFARDVPEEVAAIAAPNQNLQSVKLMEDDNCYWYQHVGPVETTMLPLRSKRGSHICLRSTPDGA